MGDELGECVVVVVDVVDCFFVIFYLFVVFVFVWVIGDEVVEVGVGGVDEDEVGCIE